MSSSKERVKQAKAQVAEEAGAEESAELRSGGAFTLRTERVRSPEWDDDEYVVVKERSWRDDQVIASRAATGGRAVKLEELRTEQQRKQFMSEAELDIAATSEQQMLASIVKWTLKGPDGKVVPVSLEWIRKLSRSYGDVIMEAVERLNPTRDDDFPRASANGADGSEGQDAAGAD